MAFTLPALPFPSSALEPHIDARTMEIHHDKHHQTYVTNLNKALESVPDMANASIEDIVKGINQVPDSVRTAVRNNGGGHLNHTMFWDLLTPGGSNMPSGALLEAINGTFTSFDKFKEQFALAAAQRFGSGWAWLVIDAAGKLAIISTPNQDNPMMDGHTPLLGLDVWEHAYYLNYQNRRPDYVAAFWNVVNFDKVGELFNAAQ